MNLSITEIHKNSLQNLNKIKELLAQSDESGNQILEQLSIDREKLLKINKNVDEVDSNVSIGRRILRKMNWQDDKNKVIIGTSAVVIAAAAITAGVLIKK
jgi:hypothetical protein